ncbi:MAG: Asp-tRNA(Asn)/Glu-tRNA(Gln) amidotransferase subunit GatA, partial [Armatimonadetes bacterium]|nr:Asp-tRNA(Asn)/Glu-tRNA(Gln) amidotransferase subunit GatA [Armatimonadota bacterium]
MAELWELTAAELRIAMAQGEVSCREIARAHLERCASLDPTVQAFVTLTPETAMEQADRWDRARAAGEELPLLAGVPIALKDNFCTQGIRTTCSSRILGEWQSPYDATAASLVREAGCVLLGKTNLDEFAMGSSTETSAFFTTRNPWDQERVPGGSSGGSAAAVAARLAPLAAGSDTGGSI